MGGCVGVTLTSFREIPLEVLTMPDSKRKSVGGEQQYDKVPSDDAGYGALEQAAVLKVEGDLEARSSSANPFRGPPRKGQGEAETKQQLTVTETSFSQASPVPVENWEEGDGAATVASFKTYLWSIIYMPSSLRWLCLTNLFCWSSLVCYSLYFTDFVGQAVFEGDPTALPGSEGRKKYDAGVKFACWGMAGYSLSCSFYSFCLDKLVKRFRAKPVYIGGQLVYCLGMVAMAVTRSKWGVLVFSWSAGIMYSTLFTMPYLLVAHYHETDSIQCEAPGSSGRSGPCFAVYRKTRNLERPENQNNCSTRTRFEALGLTLQSSPAWFSSRSSSSPCVRVPSWPRQALLSLWLSWPLSSLSAEQCRQTLSPIWSCSRS